MISHNISIFTEGSLRGGVDTFLINLIEFWDLNDKITLFINSDYKGLKTYRKLERKNFIIKTWGNINSIFKSRHEDSKLYGFFAKYTYRILYYPILFPIIFFQLYLYFKKSNCKFLLVVNGGHPGSLYCRASVIAWSFAKSSDTCLYSVHNIPSKFSKFVLFFESFFDKLLASSCKRVITVSKSAKTDFYHTAKHFQDWNIDVIYNGIKDISKITLQKSSTYKKNNKFLKKPYILILATFEPRKGHKFLINAFVHVLKIRPDVTLVMVGDGSIEQVRIINNYILKKGLQNNIEILPYSENPYFYLKDAALCVSASQNSEPFGLTLIEAMALSTPVVASDVGGMPEVIANSGAGKIYHRNDEKECADYILEYLNSDSKRKDAGKLGRKRFLKTFRADIMAKKYKEILFNHC